MASYTTNLNLKKPAGSENVAIGDINNNMDTIDQAFGTLNSNLDKKGNVLFIYSASGTSHELTLPNGFKGIVSGLGASVSRQFLAIVDVSSGGIITLSNVYVGSGVTISSSENNEITITYQSAAVAYVGMLDFANKDLSTVTLT